MLNKTGAWNSPALTSAQSRCLRQLCHFSAPPPNQHTGSNHAPWAPDLGVASAARQQVRCRCSTSVSRTDRSTLGHITAALPVQAHATCSNDARAVALSPSEHQQRGHVQQNQQDPHMQPWQHVPVTLHPRSHAVAPPAVEPAAAVGLPADWRILQLQDANDGLSARIVSCKSVQQLLHVGRQVCRQGNKLQVVRLVVMAALVVQQQSEAHHETHVYPPGADCSYMPTKLDLVPPAQHASASAAEDEVVQLMQQIVAALTSPTVHKTPALVALSSRYLMEALYALQQLLRRACSQQQCQQIQQQIQQVAGRIPDQSVLSAIHACSSSDQLLAVVSFLQEHMAPMHTRAAFVQLARVYAPVGSQYDSSSHHVGGSLSSTDNLASTSIDGPLTKAATAAETDLAGLLMALLQEQLSQLQPHAAASIVWSIGQCQTLLMLVTLEQELQQQAQQLLEVSLSGLHRLNHRVCAMLLHGAARLQLEIAAVDGGRLQELLHHTQQQLEFCDPQALANMLWSFAQLEVQPGTDWLQAFYSRSLQLLQPQQQQADAAAFTTSSNSSSKHQLRDQQSRTHKCRQQQQQEPVLHEGREVQQCQLFLKPQELAAMLQAVVQLELQAPSNWLSAAARSCHLQLSQFGHQELALMLWSFAKLQHVFVPSHKLLVQSGLRIQQLLKQSSSSQIASEGSLQLSLHSSGKNRGGFSPRSLTLLLYSVARLQLQPQEQLLQQLWQELQHDRRQDEQIASFDWMRHDVSAETSGTKSAAAAAVGTHIGDGSSGALGRHSCCNSDNSMSGPVAPAAADAACQVDSWVAAVYCQTTEILWQYNAQDLALLAWGLARHQQQSSGQVHLYSTTKHVSPEWFATYLQVAARQLQQGRFTSQGISMMLWGLGTLVTRETLGVSQPGISDGQSQLAISAAAAAFWAGLEQQTIQKLGDFNSHEVANLLWGAGALCRYKPLQNQPSREWADLLACHCLDGVEQLSGYQLVSALQALIWLKHPRGLHLLQQSLSEAWSARLSAAGSQELLLLLRACMYYKHTPEPAALQQLLMSLRRQAGSMAGGHVAQVLYLLGKMQQQHTKRQNKVLLQQLGAAKSAAIAGCRLHTITRSSNSSLLVYKGSSAVQQQQMQQPPAVQQLWLVPGVVQSELVQHVSSKLACCSVLEVSLMMWGIAQLAGTGLHHHHQEQQQQQRMQDKECMRHISTPGEQHVGSSISSADLHEALAGVFADQAVGKQLLQEVYQYSLKNLQRLSANQVAMLLHAMHKLGVLNPPPEWLTAVMGQLSSHMGELHGQGLAVLIVSLSSFNWSPPRGWLEMYLEAVAGVDAAGGLSTEWQQACVLNGLSAMDPIMGQKWLHRMNSRVRLTKRACTVDSPSSTSGRTSSNAKLVKFNGIHTAAA